MKRLILAEILGTLLFAIILGSAVMGEQLAAGNAALALLVNTLATVFGLYVLITLFLPISGAHFNPIVSLVLMLSGQLSKRHFVFYVLAQCLGAALAAWLVHLMFDLPIWQISNHARDGWHLFVGEVVATAGLLLIVLLFPKEQVAIGIACYIGAGYWFTSSTSFANPAGNIARMLSNTPAGIAPSSMVQFSIAQLIGALLGWWLSILLTAQHQRNKPRR